MNKNIRKAYVTQVCHLMTVYLYFFKEYGLGTGDFIEKSQYS